MHVWYFSIFPSFINILSSSLFSQLKQNSLIFKRIHCCNNIDWWAFAVKLNVSNIKLLNKRIKEKVRKKIYILKKFIRYTRHFLGRYSAMRFLLSRCNIFCRRNFIPGRHRNCILDFRLRFWPPNCSSAVKRVHKNTNIKLKI